MLKYCSFLKNKKTTLNSTLDLKGSYWEKLKTKPTKNPTEPNQAELKPNKRPAIKVSAVSVFPILQYTDIASSVEYS